MDNIEETLKSALADPDLMSKVSSVLSSLNNQSENTEKPSFPNISNLSGILPSDDRTRLLLALKPFLSEKRSMYMDSAVNILKLVSVGKIGKDLKLF